MVTCLLGIGSNLGNRRKNIRLALQKIDAMKGTKIIKLSRIIETKPVGGPPAQGKFLNAALKIKTSLTPIKLLKKLKEIEKNLGRKKTVRYGPRIIDLDILFYSDKIINRKELKVPHPKLFERDFVIRPLSEII
ncbi:MAG: 2-amino-4-hydroxy-6-hydroxymethyldihydropteridine diphosphokinase [Candidatus Omnitrophica bacterium]|nr:2-amino-4-hydroxy-6-hydroxymethyldihydropteridine diphosphokinase [Candidatus Omnitrophota bacterium]MDD5237935.1 2-amino-4-hydroxy-6-hydroxymethyldihydropteridine diphosphokinase [Candidatus Omnitrophota bacterium]